MNRGRELERFFFCEWSSLCRNESLGCVAHVENMKHSSVVKHSSSRWWCPARLSPGRRAGLAEDSRVRGGGGEDVERVYIAPRCSHLSRERESARERERKRERPRERERQTGASEGGTHVLLLLLCLIIFSKLKGNRISSEIRKQHLGSRRGRS